VPRSVQSLALPLLLGAALFLFFYGSGMGFRSDEVWSLKAVSGSFAEMMEVLRGDVHPPLYYWLLAVWIRLAGTGEVAVRALSALLCLAAAAAVYVSARDWFGPRGGWFAAALFVASPLTGVVAQLARMYGLLALASALSTLAFLRLARGEPRSRDWALYVAANIAGSFTHVWFFFLLFAQACAYLAFRRANGLAKMAAAAAASLAPYAVLWLPVLFRQIRTTGQALAWTPKPDLGTAAQTTFLLGGVFLLAAPFLWTWWKRREPGPMPVSLPAMIAAVALAVPFALSFWKPVFWPRFTVIALPAVCVALAGIAPAASRFRLEAAMLAGACGLALATGVYLRACDSRTAAEYLARVTRDGDMVVFTSLSRLPIDYYWDRIQPGRRVEERSFPRAIDSHPGFEGVVDTPEAQARLRAEAGRLTAEAAARGGRVFLLHGYHPWNDRIVREMFEQAFQPVEGVGLTCVPGVSYFERLSAYACSTGF
jgi:hypothetical protein